MHRIAFALILGLAAACRPPRVAAQYTPPDPCVTTDFDSIARLPDDTKGRRYLVRFRDGARSIAGSGTFRLDTMDAHVIAPFDGSMTIVRAALDRDVVAAAIVSVQAHGRDVACPLRATVVQAVDPASDAAIVPHTRTSDVVPVADPPMTCEHPFVDSGADHSVAVAAPPIARQQGIGGIVVVSVVVDENGKPRDARVVSSPSAILNSAALAAARAMTYPWAPCTFRAGTRPRSR